MMMLSLKEMKKAVRLCIEAGVTPNVEGKHGLGKTESMKELAEEMGAKLVVIEGTLLSEGDLGGLPITSRGEDGIITTEFALHTKLAEVKRLIDKDEKVILFIDEWNRNTTEVKNELMNIVLNREINGFILPKDKVYVVAASNPCEDGYEVGDVDPAIANRFCYLRLMCDTEAWLDWALSKTNGEIKRIDLKPYNKNEQKTNIDVDIIDFISSHPGYLHLDNNSDEPMSATPRSWAFASDLYRAYNLNKEAYSDNILEAVITGVIGSEANNKLMEYLNSNERNFLTPEQILNMDIKELQARFKNTEALTKRQIMETLIEALNSKKINKKELKRLVELMGVKSSLMGLDLKIACVTSIIRAKDKMLYNAQESINYKNEKGEIIEKYTVKQLCKDIYILNSKKVQENLEK